jgi:hypothetical protein
MPYSRMLRCVALVRIEISVERSAFIITVELQTTLAATSNRRRFFPRATRRNIPEDGILHSHCRETLKSYITLTGWTL